MSKSKGFEIPDQFINPEYTHNDEQRARILERRQQQEFQLLGLDQNLIVSSLPRRVRDNAGVLHDVGHYIHIRNKYEYTGPDETDAECDMQALLMYQFNWRDGDPTIQDDGKPGRLWDFHAMILPYFYRLNGVQVELPTEILTYGYQAVAHNYHTVDVPHIRPDTICMTSMPMGGHLSSEGHSGLGCDCDVQRNLGQEIVYKEGGITVLSPLEGRGNGLKAHGSQLMRQSLAVKYREPVPDTYEAVQELRYPKDNRGLYYPLETALVMMFGKPTSGKIILHSNNPEKKRAFEREGLLVGSQYLFDKSRQAYYQSGNYIAKAEIGGHARIDNIDTFFQLGGEEDSNSHKNGVVGDNEVLVLPSIGGDITYPIV